MTKDDGGAAFPVNTAASVEPGAYCPDPGMTLRDWFAGQALAGQLAGEKAHLPEMITITSYAVDAYRIADAMLATRKAQS